MAINPWVVLGVRRTASHTEIKAAYRKLARKYHPDVSREEDALVRMKELNVAFTTALKTPPVPHRSTTRTDTGGPLRRWGTLG